MISMKLADEQLFAKLKKRAETIGDERQSATVAEMLRKVRRVHSPKP